MDTARPPGQPGVDYTVGGGITKASAAWLCYHAFAAPMTHADVTFDFAHYGEVLSPRAGVIAVDVGSTCVAGVIDHHFTGAGEECAATLVATRGEELVLRHLREAPAPTLTIVMHREPDLDCLVSASLAIALLREGAVPAGGLALAEYARVIEAGLMPPDGLGPTSLWALYTAATHLLSTAAPERPSEEETTELYRAWVARGLELVELALAGAPERVDDVYLPEDLPGWATEQAFIDEAQARYAADREAAEVLTLALPRPEGGVEPAVPGLRIRSPRSALFRHFAQAEGFPLTHLILERPAPGRERHLINLAPESGLWLRGLGAALERREAEARLELGQLRPPSPRWPDVTNADPWYDGRSPIHGYSLVDTPHGGTVLAIDEVTKVVDDSEAWIPLGRPARELLCPKGCRLSIDAGASFCPYHAHKLMPALVDGRYEVEELIAEGGMGSVWRVHDMRTSLPYALKRLLHQYLGIEEVWKRFQREASLASRLDHPNVVRLFASGTSAEAGPYFVTELVDGIDLRRDIAAFQERREWYPWPRMRSILLQVCYALSAVHEAGVLHRDLKPENIMLVGEQAGDDNPWPPIKVLDFGLSIVADPRAERFTVAGMISGTAEYAAPEQMAGGALDARADLYALGSIFHELLAFEPPFADQVTPTQIGLAKVSREAAPLERGHPQLEQDPRVEALVRRLLARDPDRRPASAAEVAAALDEIPPEPDGEP